MRGGLKGSAPIEILAEQRTVLCAQSLFAISFFLLCTRLKCLILHKLENSETQRSS